MPVRLSGDGADRYELLAGEVVVEEARYWIRQMSGDVQGPFAASRIRRWAQEGRARPSMMFSEDGHTWVLGSDLPDLFSSSAAPAPPPPPAPPRQLPRHAQARVPSRSKDESRLPSVRLPRPPSNLWVRQFQRAQQRIRAKFEMAGQLQKASKQHKSGSILSTIVAAFSASIALDRRNRPTTRAVAGVISVGAAGTAVRQSNLAVQAEAAASEELVETCDALDDLVLNSGAHALASDSYAGDRESFLATYHGIWDGLSVLLGKVPTVAEVLLQRSACVPTGRFMPMIMRGAWIMPNESLSRIGAFLDRMCSHSVGSAQRAFRRWVLPYTVYSAVGLLIAMAAILSAMGYGTMSAGAKSVAAIVSIALLAWGSSTLGRALAWQAVLRLRVRQIQSMGTQRRLARWYGLLSDAPDADAMVELTEERPSQEVAERDEPWARWMVPAPMSLAPYVIAAVAVALCVMVANVRAELAALQEEQAIQASSAEDDVSAIDGNQAGGRSVTRTVRSEDPPPPSSATQNLTSSPESSAVTREEHAEEDARQEALRRERFRREAEARRQREEAKTAREKKEAEQERRRQEAEAARHAEALARFKAAVPGVYRAAQVPGPSLGLGDEPDVRYELALDADGNAGAALFVRGLVRWKASGTWELFDEMRPGGRGLRIVLRAHDASINLATRVEAGAQWTDAQDAALSGREGGRGQPPGVYRIRGPFFRRDLQPVVLIRTEGSLPSNAIADPVALTGSPKSDPG